MAQEAIERSGASARETSVLDKDARPTSQTPTTPLSAADIDDLRERIDARLCAFFPAGGRHNDLVNAIRHGLLSPGKRVRPLITLLACRQSGADYTQALDAACAVEMVHTASLIMDDLPSMDDADLRRGQPTTHRLYGEGAAMLASVTMLNEAYKVLAATPVKNAEARLRAISHLSGAVGLSGLAGGQANDLNCEGANGPRALCETEQRHIEKTGALFAAAAAIGGEIAGASPSVIQRLSSFGHDFGLAFQAFDDVIDMVCTSDEAGKDVAQDAGKSTVVSLLGAEGANASAERWLASAIDHAKRASAFESAPLAELAELVGAKFRSMTCENAPA